MRTVERYVRMALMLALAAGATGELEGQQGRWEAGFDGGWARTMFDEPEVGELPDVDQFAFDLNSVRLAYFVTDRLAFEPRVRAARGSQGDDTSSAVAFMPGFVWHFNDATGTTPYLKASGGVTWSKLDTDDPDRDISHTAWRFGGAAGIKHPVASMALLRFEAGYQRMRESDLQPGGHELRLGVGVSLVID